MVDTQLGPRLALTSWTTVLSALELEAVDDPGASGDLVQLRALCDSADNEAFTPASSLELSDQRTPAFILQLGSIIQEAVDYAVTENVVSIARLRPSASWERIGRYVWIPGDRGANPWLGIQFGLWKSHGATPLWLTFADDNFGRAQEVSGLIEPWAAKNGILTATIPRHFAIGLDVPAGEDKAGVIRSLVGSLRSIGAVLAALPPTTVSIVEQER